MEIDFQRALALLLRDAGMRCRLRDDPGAIIAQMKLDEADAAALNAISAAALDQQAHTLVRKRFSEVAAFLPRTLATLNNAFEQFEEFAAGFWPEGHRRHFEDALAFARWLTRRSPGYVCSSERNRLEFIASGRRLGLRARKLMLGRRSRQAIQLFIRWNRRPREWTFYLGL